MSVNTTKAQEAVGDYKKDDHQNSLFEYKILLIITSGIKYQKNIILIRPMAVLCL